MKSFYKLIFRLWETRRFRYGSLFLIHAILAFLAFFRHFQSPEHTAFVDWGDGMKNNFTLLSFVKEPIGEEGVFKYEKMNYPFGDYVYATDNTPFFSVPFRWFCHHIYDMSDYTLPVFNFFIIACIVLSGLVAFWVFKRLLKSPLLAWLLAIILPWTNFQIPRVYRGHYNLSLALLSISAIALFMVWVKYQRGGNRIKLAGIWCVSLLFCYACFLIHGYYIAIIPVFLSGMLVFFGIYRLIKNEKGVWSIVSGTTILAGTGLLAYLTLQWTDAYFPLRQTTARGYDWMEQKTNFSLLFTHYNFQSLFFPLWSTKDANGTELMSYLGNIGLYTMAVFFLTSLFNRNFRVLLWTVQKRFFSDPLKTGIVLSGLLLLSMSFGERYFPLMEPLRFSWPFRTDGGIDRLLLLFMIGMACLSGFLLIKWLRENKKRPGLSLNARQQDKITRAAWFYPLAAILLFLMFGRYSIGHWVNITNPLWVAHQFTDLVEQFRSMVRFAWPFYWSFYVWIGFTLAAVYSRLSRSGRQLVIVLVLFAGGVETRDFVNELRYNANATNLLSEKETREFKSLEIDFSNYQSILPVPYYNAGSEDYNNTIDDIDEWSRYTFQLAIYTGLPLMSSKMARTPPVYACNLLDLLIEDSVPEAVSRLLNEKPILLAVHKRFLNDSTLHVIPDVETKPHANRAFWGANDFVSRHHLQCVGEQGEVSFYKWVWQRDK